MTELRLTTKRQMQSATTAEERSALDAQQSSYKILINSFYGQLGFSMAIFNDFDEADRGCNRARPLRTIIAAIRRDGGTVVEVDTDGVLFVPPTAVQGEEAERVFLERLNTEMPPGIRIGFDGRFRKMLSYKMKTMPCSPMMAASNSRVPPWCHGRWSALVASSSSTRLPCSSKKTSRDYTICTTHTRILQHAWTVEDFARTETLKETIEQYQADVDAGRRTRSATYELAIARAAQTGQPVRKGDRITYYITGSGSGVTAFANACLADAWEATRPDENTDYLKRLDEFAGKFAVFTPEDFQQVFAPEGLFGFSADGIRLQPTTKQEQRTRQKGAAQWDVSTARLR